MRNTLDNAFYGIAESVSGREAAYRARRDLGFMDSAPRPAGRNALGPCVAESVREELTTNDKTEPR